MTATRHPLALFLACAFLMAATPALGQVCGNGATETGEQCDDGNTVNWDGCSDSCQVRLCLDPPPPDCVMAFHGTLSVRERGKEDKRTTKLRLELSGFAEDVALLDLGDPVFGLTRYDLCVYGELRYPLGSLIVARGFDTCGEKEKSCWAKKGDDTYAFADVTGVSNGVSKILLQSGPRGEGRISFTAARTKKAPYLPFMNPALKGQGYADVRLMTSDGRCFGGTFLDLLANDPQRFKARIQ